MCLIIFSYRSHPVYPLILAANRDEFYERPTAQAAFWKDYPYILAGKDLKAGGTWLGITKSGRVAAITNFRSPLSMKDSAPSRGELVNGFLRGIEDPYEYIHDVRHGSRMYNGFSIILGDRSGLFYFSNAGGDPFRKISPGTYGLSNHFMGTPWPKVERGRRLLDKIVSGTGGLQQDKIFHILADTLTPDDKSLPDTGVGLEWERILSPIFIQSEIYGTRSSTVILVDRVNNVTFTERTFIPGSGGYKTVDFSFRMNPGLF